MDFDNAEEEILRQLQSSDPRLHNRAIQELCREHWVGLTRRAMQNVGGKMDDLEDVFQESLAAMVRNVMQGKFKGQSKLSTYFFEICRRRCMALTPKKPKTQTLNWNQTGESPSLEYLLMHKESKRELRNLINQALNTLGKPCSTLLKLRQLDYSYEEIAEQMHYDNPDTAKNQAGRCRKKFRQLLEDNPVMLNQIKSLR